MLRVLLCTIVLFISVLVPFEKLTFAAQNNPKHSVPIKGVYVKASSTKGPIWNDLLTLLNRSELNAMVIDIKDDHGNLTFQPEKGNRYFPISRPYIPNIATLMKQLNDHNIYPIARMVVFKDNVLSKASPQWSFTANQKLWHNARGDSFTNPFLKEVWDHNIGMAIEAAKAGFKEIQFDYVRFPERFEKIENTLNYSKGSFRQTSRESSRERVIAITEFVKYAKQKLEPYNVKMSVDTFGNATVIAEAKGIGQNFSEIAETVDVISAMIYPSHWNSIKGVRNPDLQPFELVTQYAKMEKTRLEKLESPPISRPWLQDFTATWLGKGNYQVYGKKQIEDQIRALHNQGINEFLLWNARNTYTKNVDYSPY